MTTLFALFAAVEIRRRPRRPARPPPGRVGGSDKRGYVNRDPSRPGPRVGSYFWAAFFLRLAQ